MMVNGKTGFKRKLTTLLKSEEMFRYRSVAIMMALMFIFGMLLLMVGYTTTDLQYITGVGDRSILLAVPQSVGLIVGTLFMNLLLRKFNIRRILSVGYILALIALVLISQLDHLAGIKSDDMSTYTTVNKNKALAAYVILNFALGLGLSLTSPIANTLVGTIFKGKKRSLFLGLINGIYGVGAGIIPISASSTIYNLSQKSDFGEVRYFYYIAIAFAALAFLISFLLDYKYEKTSLTTKNMPSQKAATLTSAKQNDGGSMSRKIFISIVFMIVALFCLYLITETIANYSFKSFIVNNSNSASIKITATIAVGLFFLVQGLWRMMSGFTLAKWFRFRYFILGSVVFVITAYSIIASGALAHNPDLSYLIAILFALGIGNMWGVLFAYGSGVNNQKSAFLGVVINITAMATIPVTQAFSGAIFGLGSKGTLILGLIGIGGAIGVVTVMYGISYYLKRSGFEHPDDSRKYHLPAFLQKKPKASPKEAAANHK